MITTPVFRDPSAWYHILIAVDTTQATSTNRFKLYVNGTQFSTFSTATYPSLNQDLVINSAIAHGLGRGEQVGEYFDGYLADIHFIDGQALTPSSFTEVSATTGQLIPKAYSGPTPTGNSFWLPFSDNSAATATTLGKDNFNLGNNWTPNNLSTDSSSNNWSSQTSTSGNFALYDGSPANLFDGSTATIWQWSGTTAVARFTPANPISYTSQVRIYVGVTGNIANTRWSVNGCALQTFPYAGTQWLTVLSGTGTFTEAALHQNGDIYTMGWNAVEVDGSILVNTTAAGNDSLVDTPTNYGTDTGVGNEVRGNYCTLNPLDKATTGGALSNGNLDYAATVASWDMVRATFGISSGKWYWEVYVNSTTYGITGIAQASVSLNNNFFHTGICYGYNANSGWKYEGSPYAALAYGATWNGSGDICGVAFNSDAGTLTFYKNGVSQGVAYTGLTGTFFPAHTSYPTGSATFNFGQRPFAYTAPSGFKALCTTNLPEPTIADGSTVMDVALYTGNGSTQTISGLNFSPDLVWIKRRNAAASHMLYDQVRTLGNPLSSDLTAAEPSATVGMFTAFQSDGFTVAVAGGNN